MNYLYKLILFVLLISIQEKVVADNELNNYLSIKAYLSIPTWDKKERYNSSHFLMVPMHYIYKNNLTPLEKDFDVHINKFLDQGVDTIDLNIHKERLTTWQYYYFLSEYAVLSNYKNERLNNYLLGNVKNFWLKSTAWQWGGVNNFKNMRERVNWKLKASINSHDYRVGIIDEELFLFGVAANLKKKYPNDKDLNDIVQIALEVFKRRSSFTKEGGWLFDMGIWDNYNDYAYAGYSRKDIIKSKKPLKQMVTDSSHFFRMPKLLLSLENAGLDKKDKLMIEKYRKGLNKQFFEKVLVIRSNHIYLTNYMDGRNGIFRWEYPSLGKGKGYGPYELTYSFGMGWWVFLSSQDIKQTYTNYYHQIRENISEDECDMTMKKIIEQKKIIDRKSFNECLYIYNSFLSSNF
ncbi:hypothetical protein [Acinetobacter pittii]|uniref:hypothetical protein n=2 Tax=Acinetobacter pittii TaxID=48296 RepID=UPI0034CDF34A